MQEGGRFTLQDLHQHFLWLPSRWLSTPWSHLNKPNFESKTLSEVLSLAPLRVCIRGTVNPTRGGCKGHKSSLKVSAFLTHIALLNRSPHVVSKPCDEDSAQPGAAQ